VLAVAVVFVGVVTLVVLSALQATMQGVYAAALYRHATEPQRPGDPFGAEILQSAFLTKA
jgi:hypothetical protein